MNQLETTPVPTAADTPRKRKRPQQWALAASVLTLALTAAALYAILASAPTQPEPGRVRSDGDAAPAPVLIELAATPEPERISASIRISQYTELHPGDDYPAVQQLQSQLSALGYLDMDEPDTVYSAALADAVSLFQRAHGLEVNGEADAAVQEKLFAREALAYQVRLGDEGADVTELQSALETLGYFIGKASGYFGPATEEALLAFQQANGLAQDGVFDADDRDLLYSPQAKPSGNAKLTAEPTAAPEKNAVEKTPAPKRTQAPEKSDPPAAPPPEPTEPSATIPPEAIPTETPPPAFEAPPQIPESTEPPQQEPEPPFEPDDAQEQPPEAPGGDVIEGVIETALAQIGKPYRRGNEGPNSYDCSGLVYYCLTQNGVDIGRYSAASYAKVSDWKKITSMSDLRRGDLIFYHDDDSSRVSHVGICLGDGTMIDASSNKSQIVHRSHTTSYWKRNFVCGRRVF